MRIEDFRSTSTALTASDLRRVLEVRYDDANSFWLSHDGETKPALSILVRDNLAYVQYFPDDSHPGFACIGEVKGLRPGESTTFFLDNADQEQEILNECIIPWPRALEVATEFLVSRQLPHAIKWSEL